MLNCKCISGEAKLLLEESIINKRDELGFEYSQLKKRKGYDVVITDIKKKHDKLNKLYHEVHLLKVCDDMKDRK